MLQPLRFFASSSHRQRRSEVPTCVREEHLDDGASNAAPDGHDVRANFGERLSDDRDLGHDDRGVAGNLPDHLQELQGLARQATRYYGKETNGRRVAGS